MYRHTQTSPLHWLLHISALAVLVSQVFVPTDPVGTTALVLLAGLLVCLGFCFRELTVSVDDVELSVQYGPIPLFAKRISLANITQVEAGRSSWIDGWGIHYVPGRGWTYNLWGFDCVQFNLDGKRFRVGTDDRDNLLLSLTDKITPA